MSRQHQRSRSNSSKWSQTEDGRPKLITSRIIAIPGLGADPEYTWKKNKVHWLRDANMLPKKIPHAKISVFQYQSQWFGKGSVDERIDNVATKLLHGLDRSRVGEHTIATTTF